MRQFGGIELGGTKMIVVRGAPGTIGERHEFPTSDPVATLAQAARILEGWHRETGLAAVGIASFGPIRVDPDAADHGTILATPKPGWGGTDILSFLRSSLRIPVAIDTDVNAAALAEYHYGAAKGCGTTVYVTIGTGVGGGVLVNGVPLHGLMHPEIGHLRLRRVAGDGFAGACTFHGDCIEGLLSGPALAARFGSHPSLLDPADRAWSPVAADLAELLGALLLAYSPHRIVLGGGVMTNQPHLLAAAVSRIPGQLADYLDGVNEQSLRDIVVPAALGNDAGPHGALIVARMATAQD